jgi:multidrug efflux system membrane fusion protein
VRDARKARVPVSIVVAGEQGFPHQGYIDFVDNQINAATGTLPVRGKFPNADGNLLPGMFVRMQIPVSGEVDALLITDRAVSSDQGQKFVYVLNGERVERRSVTLGPVIDGLRLVRQGLKPEDEVVIDGLMKVQPGSPVKAEHGRMEQFASDQLEMKSTVGAPPKSATGK